MSLEHRSLSVAELDPAVSPFDLARAFEGDRYSCLLESTASAGDLGRYSFYCAEPFFVFSSKRSECFAGAPGNVERLSRAPLVELAALLERYRFPPATSSEWPPFVGGAVGYLGYELLYLIEEVPDRGRDDLPVPDCQLLFFHTVIAADAHTGKTWCFANGFGATAADATREAEARRDAMLERVRGVTPSDPSANEVLRRRRTDHLRAQPQLTDDALASANVVPVMDHARYVAVVEEVRSEIHAGNVFEVCTSNRFDTTFTGSGLDLYGVLRSVNEAPFAAYLRLDDLEVVSSSPERFLEVDRDRWVETRPMKGTRPRGRTPEEDERNILDLATCEKSSAENMMIVDLARNDLGRVCQFRTIEVPRLRVVETYAFTHQLVSTIRGRLNDDVDVVDLLRATFPGGSMTGAPKIEALDLIDRLEPVKRGVFSGSIGYIGFDGVLDLNIVIRTLIKKGSNLSFHVGGAIVADSDPEGEYQETLDKAHGLVVALDLARELASERGVR